MSALDSTGRPIKVGDVVTHVNRSGSSMDLHTGVVRRVGEDSIIWQRVNDEYVREAGSYVYANNGRLLREKRLGRETAIYKTSYCTITGMTEAEMLALFGMDFGFSGLNRGVPLKEISR